MLVSHDTPASRLVLLAARNALSEAFHPRILLMSLLPLLMAGLLLLLLAWWGWDGSVQSLREWVDGMAWVDTASDAMGSFGLGWLTAILVPLLLILLVVPPVLLVSLLVVSSMTTPWIAGFVRSRHFADLGTAPPVSMWRALWWSMGSAWLAMGLFIVSLPLWFIPPLNIVLPSAIGGWLTYRVMAFDILSGIASDGERQAMLKRHRLPLLIMGMACGYLGALPATLWVFGLFWSLLIGPLLLLASLWAYMLGFCFMSLWFSHFLLAVLHKQRGTSPNRLEST